MEPSSTSYHHRLTSRSPELCFRSRNHPRLNHIHKSTEKQCTSFAVSPQIWVDQLHSKMIAMLRQPENMVLLDFDFFLGYDIRRCAVCLVLCLMRLHLFMRTLPTGRAMQDPTRICVFRDLILMLLWFVCSHYGTRAVRHVTHLHTLRSNASSVAPYLNNPLCLTRIATWLIINM